MTHTYMSCDGVCGERGEGEEWGNVREYREM
jgi:hypothetical protein